MFQFSGCMGDTQFHFRIRQCPGRKHINKSHIEYNRECPIQLKVCLKIPSVWKKKLYKKNRIIKCELDKKYDYLTF